MITSPALDEGENCPSAAAPMEWAAPDDLPMIG